MAGYYPARVVPLSSEPIELLLVGMERVAMFLQQGIDATQTLQFLTAIGT
jgi:hypothetical protein